MDADIDIIEPGTNAGGGLEPARHGLLPAGQASPTDLRHMVEAWVASKRSKHTRNGYRRDLIGEQGTSKRSMKTPAWIPWCLSKGADPLAVRQPYVDAYARQLEADGSSSATIARKLAAISSWYTFLVRQELTDKNPAKWAARPEIDKDTSNAVGLNEDELRRFLAAADEDGPRTSAVMRMLALNGVRVSVITSARVGDLGHDRGHRTIKYRLKGGKETKAPLTEEVTSVLDIYLATRKNALKGDALFVTDAGQPLDQPHIWRAVKSLACQAGVPSWEELSPHSLRHTFATLALGMGIPLAVVQDAMGHKDPRTTQRYNRARFQLDNHPTYALADRVLSLPNKGEEATTDSKESTVHDPS